MFLLGFCSDCSCVLVVPFLIHHTSSACNAFHLTPVHSTLPTSSVRAFSPSFGNKAIVLPIGPTGPQDVIVLNGFDKWSGKEVEIGF